MNEKKIKLLIIHPIDLLGDKIDGVRTFIKSFIKYLPETMEVGFVGVTSDKKSRRVGEWQELEVCKKKIETLPVCYVEDENKRGSIPLSLKFVIAIIKYRKLIPTENRILNFHRIEPMLPFKNRLGKSVLIIHGDMQDLYSRQTEIKWKAFPWLYFLLERRLMSKLDKIFVVRRDGVKFYKNKYPLIKDNFSFLPTWADTEIFYPARDYSEKRQLKECYLKREKLSEDTKLITYAGRLEGQKDPVLLIDTFYRVNKREQKTQLLIVGTGSLKNKMKEKIKGYGLEGKVSFVRPLPQNELADVLRISDVFLLTSASEGMPMSVLEALACGLPVVTTNAGEVGLVVEESISGFICESRTPDSLAAAVLCVIKDKIINSEDCVSAVKKYTAENILTGFYGELAELHLSS